METIADLYKGLNMVFKETKNLLEIVLTYPITSNKGERSFSSLKLLLSSSRTTMCESRMCNLARMAIHSSRVNALENNVIVKQYADAYPCRLSYRITEDEDENDEGSICLLFCYIFQLQLGQDFMHPQKGITIFLFFAFKNWEGIISRIWKVMF